MEAGTGFQVLVSMKSKTEINVFFKDSKSSKSAADAVKQEGIGKRVRSTLSIKKNKLTIKLDADDIVALRAAVNTYLRSLQVIEKL